MTVRPIATPSETPPPLHADDLLQTLLGGLFDGVVMIDRYGQVVAVNPAAEAIFGHRAADLIGQEASLLFAMQTGRAEGDLANGLALPGETGAERHSELTGRRCDGTLFPMLVSLSQATLDGDPIQVAVVRDISERKEAEETIRDMALNDSLTGLANRNLFRRRLEDAFRTAGRRGRLVALMLLNLDGFKSINDSFGHRVGDALLMNVADRLRKVTRNVDTVARLGGDEFALIMVELETPQAARGLAERIIDSLSEPVTLEGCLLTAGAGIGISFFPHDDTDPDELIRKANLALHEAKNGGRGSYGLYTQVMNTRARAAKVLETDLRLALVREEFLLHYQPKLSIDGRRVVGCESLIRWQHPSRGLVSPEQFIAIAESSDVMVPLGEWVLREACAQNKAWQDAGLPSLQVAVNISARQFQDDDFVAMLRNVLRETGLEPRWLELEITEGMVMDDTDQVINKFRQISDLGIEISIDDFGTGYSSLAYLKRFPVQRLKIDQSFVRDLVSEPDDAAITEAVIKMGHSLNLKVIAEGVESQDQVTFLRSKGCDELQGFLFSEPLPPEDFVRWIKAWMRPRAV